jgi:hypothetical protein
MLLHSNVNLLHRFLIVCFYIVKIQNKFIYSKTTGKTEFMNNKYTANMHLLQQILRITRIM